MTDKASKAAAHLGSLRWKNISTEDRSKEMSALAKKRWAKRKNIKN